MLIRRLFPVAVAALGFHATALAQPDAKELNEPTLYELLLGEIAMQRGDYALAAKTYLELARRTGDARVARRAVEVANQGKLPELALEAAKTWQEIEPKSPAALQVVAALLVSAKRVDEASSNTPSADPSRPTIASRDRRKRSACAAIDTEPTIEPAPKVATRNP